MVSPTLRRPPIVFSVEAGRDIALAAARAKDLGFNALLMPSPPLLSDGSTDISGAVSACKGAGLALWLDLSEPERPLDDPVVRAHPSAFALRHDMAQGPLDPRNIGQHRQGAATLRRFDSPALAEQAAAQVKNWVQAGAAGIVLRGALLAEIGTALADVAPKPVLVAASGGPPPSSAHFALVAAGVEAASATLTLVELARFGRVWPAQSATRLQALRLAAFTGNGLIVPEHYSDLDEGLAREMRAIANLFTQEPALAGPGARRALSGSGALVSIRLRTEGADPRLAKRAVIALINTDPAQAVALPAATITRVSAEFAPFANLTGSEAFDAPLGPGEVRLISALRRDAVKDGAPPMEARKAAAQPRVIIGHISPSVDEGRYVVKRTVGDTLVIEADIFSDGHEQLAACIAFKAADDTQVTRVPMTALPNDRWQAELPLPRMGRHSFAVEAWLDVWGGFRRDFTKKRDAGNNLSLEIREGAAFLDAAKKRAQGQTGRVIDEARTATKGEETAAIETLLSAPLAEAMASVDDRPFLATSFEQPVDVERLGARFSSWYELFPRSITDSVKRHGTFRDVIGRLPAVRDMGFDVLYFPPIHPIGLKNRKGKNNSVTAQPGEVGSPYAIGSEAGGHDALHPELGTLADFKALVEAAHEHGLELALDFAIQCSPDHPWLKQHPTWFAWRPDGSMKYAENPPKKYQDIVNVDFYASGSVPDLWVALRDVVLFWVKQGVKLFRVDNPHTKPLPFWQWMIGDIRAKHPDVIFLSEAFTRPKVMYHLAKVGYSQSYTYFTWRNSKHEFVEYLNELNYTEVKDYFRPHFFVNTPDINPIFLQTSGRGGFLIRAALAATLSGLWGVYSGFELCEAAPLPGKEEYLDSEKYELRPRDWNAPGNIIAEITQLNRIRQSEPALQSHLNTSFYNAFNDQILYFGKTAPGDDGKVLVAISMDPHNAQEAHFEVPLWEWGLPDHASVEVTDLLTGAKFVWNGKTQHMRLTPQAPYAIWSVRPRAGF